MVDWLSKWCGKHAREGAFAVHPVISILLRHGGSLPQQNEELVCPRGNVDSTSSNFSLGVVGHG